MERRAKEMNTKAKGHTVTALNQSNYQVVSGSSGKVYRVWVGESATGKTVCKCNCRWGYYSGKHGNPVVCSHVLAVQQLLAGKKKVSAWSSQEQAKRQHRKMLDLSQGVTVTIR